MNTTLLWLLAAAPAAPIAAILVTYRRVVTEKIKEVELRLKIFEDSYARAYGGANVLDVLHRMYHWRAYAGPAAVFMAATALAGAIALLHAGASLGLDSEVEALARRVPDLALIAAGGAYLWGLADLVRRHRGADLSPHAVNLAWLKMLIAAAIGPLLGSAMQAPLSYWTAFIVGAVPVASIWDIIRDRANIQIKNEPAEEPSLHLIEGCTRDVIERLADEGITSVQQLAFSNPVKLLFRTNLEWNVILDLVDQSLLVNYLGNAAAKLRPMGIRGAIELAALYERRRPDVDTTKADKAIAQGMLARVGEVLAIGEVAAISIASQVHEDAVVDFIWDVYNAPADNKNRRKPVAPRSVNVARQPLVVAGDA
jgi:hypothetical protein